MGRPLLASSDHPGSSGEDEGYLVDNVIPKKSLGTIGLGRQGDTTKYIPKFQVAKMSLEVAEI